MPLSGCGNDGPTVRCLEQAGGEGAEDEAADVGQVRYSSGLRVRYLAGVKQLSQEPDADQQRCRDECDLHKN